MMRALLLASLTVTVAYPAEASMYCPEPSEPVCIDSFGTFDNEFSFDQCRTDVENFVSDVEDYVDCLDQEQQMKIDEANRAIERFNCKAQGDNFCP